MKSPGKLIMLPVLIMLEILLLVVVSPNFKVFAARLDQGIMTQLTSGFAPTPQTSPFLATNQCASISFRDEFNGNELDPDKWDVYKGTPTVGDGWLTLPAADIQSKALFQPCIILYGLIQSTDWKPQDQFTDSSFGFEIWIGQCHYAVIFKASGHLAALRAQPDANGNCSGDPLNQVYVPISNWDSVRATGTVTFTLTWSNSITLGVSDGGQNSGQASYTGPAIPTVPLKIRLYAHTFDDTSVTETYKFDYIRLCPCSIYLPIIIRE